MKAVRVNPGTVLAAGATGRKRKAGKVLNKSPNSYFVLNDSRVLTGTDITNPQQGFDEGGGGSGQPNVTFGFTSHGKSVFQNVTKKIAHRGQEAQLPGVGKEAAQQHFAVVLDGQLITTPSIDYTKYPEGIDATTGLADLGRLHDHLRAGTRRTSCSRARCRSSLELISQLAGVGDARQTGAQPGPRRGPRRLRRGVPVPAVLLPRARRDRRRRPGDLRHLLLRADQADPDHADAAGHRRPDPHDRRRGRREHRDLRARQGGDPRRQIGDLRHRDGLSNAASRRSSTRTSSRS